MLKIYSEEDTPIKAIENLETAQQEAAAQVLVDEVAAAADTAETAQDAALASKVALATGHGTVAALTSAYTVTNNESATRVISGTEESAAAVAAALATLIQDLTTNGVLPVAS